MATANITLFIMGILVYLVDFGTYPNVLYREVNLWGKGPIIDAIQVNVNHSCPSDYEAIVG
jgi:hypothetical protein